MGENSIARLNWKCLKPLLLLKSLLKLLPWKLPPLLLLSKSAAPVAVAVRVAVLAVVLRSLRNGCL